MLQKTISNFLIKFLSIFSTQRILSLRGKINLILQKRIFKSLITLKSHKFPVGHKDGGPFIAFLGYNTHKSSIERFFVKPNVLLYSKDKKYIYLQFQFLASSKSIIESRLKPGIISYYIIKKRRKNELKMHKISAKKAFFLISCQVPFTSTYLDRNPRLIPASVKKNVWVRDKGVCVNCGNSSNLEYDHVIPYSKGGSPTEANIQLLCKKCNLHKSAKIILDQ